MEQKCLILLACYNGEKYIRQQIESIQCQSWKNWKLLIRDDGSKDKTVEIVKQFCENDERIQLMENHSNLHGAYPNFWNLIQYAKNNNTFDYYFFADQDDVWLPEKLETMITFAEKSGYTDIPLMVYADMEVVDGEGKRIYESINSIMGIGEMHGDSLFFAHGFVWGCDAMVNRVLLEKTPMFPLDDTNINIMSHDNYFGKFALCFGKLLFLDKVLIQHRRHGNNTTGGYNIKLNLLRSVNKAVFQFKDLSKTHARVYSQTLFAIREFEKNGFEDTRFKEFKSAIEKGGFKFVSVLKRHNVRRKQKSRTIALYLIGFLGSYKKYMFD